MNAQRFVVDDGDVGVQRDRERGAGGEQRHGDDAGDGGRRRHAAVERPNDEDVAVDGDHHQVERAREDDDGERGRYHVAQGASERPVVRQLQPN